MLRFPNFRRVQKRRYPSLYQQLQTYDRWFEWISVAPIKTSSCEISTEQRALDDCRFYMLIASVRLVGPKYCRQSAATVQLDSLTPIIGLFWHSIMLGNPLDFCRRCESSVATTSVRAKLVEEMVDFDPSTRRLT